MERFEYWMVEAPSKSIKFKKLSKGDDLFAHTVIDGMNELARDGWQFLRTEIMVEDRRSFLWGSSRQQHTYMVYRRALRTNGMSLADPVAPQRVRKESPPNIEMLRKRISTVMSDPSPAIALQG